MTHFFILFLFYTKLGTQSVFLKIEIYLLFFAFLIIIHCSEDLPIDVNIDPWDIDGDGISNQVENNNANSYLNLNDSIPNSDPTIAHGLPTNGSLENGLNIVDNGDIYHKYYHYYGSDLTDTDDWGTLYIIRKIESAARWWKENYWFRFGVGDLSLKNGGYFFPHISHQNGLDADFRYIRTDEEEKPLDLSTSDSIYFDQEKTALLMSALLYLWGDTTNTIFFIDTNYVKIYDPSNLNRVRHESGHANHFHMRIPDPDGTNN